MKLNYRTRLLLGFLCLPIIASGLVFFLSTRHSKATVLEQIQSTVTFPREAVRDKFGFDEVGDLQPHGFSDFIWLYSVRRLSSNPS